MSVYRKHIEAQVDESFDTRHVEAWMRLEHGTLDALSFDQFRSECIIAVECIIAAGVEKSERLAVSMGL